MDYMYPRINIPEYDKPKPDKEIRGNKKCRLCYVSVKDWQRHLDAVMHNIKKHDIKYHKPLPDPNNVGNKLCKLCNIKVKDYYKHTFSELHRFNQDLGSVIFFHSVSDFVDHFNQLKDEKEIDDILNCNKENIFWNTAKEELDAEQYKQLGGEIIGKTRRSSIRRKR